MATISGHNQWRDCQAWLDQGIPLTTTSNEAAKLFDMTITQLLALYDDKNLGGVKTTLSRLLQADPDWVMGHAVLVGVKFLSQEFTVEKHADYQQEINVMLKVAQQKNLSEWEALHVKGAQLCSKGHMDKAVYVWEDILALYPTDVWALKLAYITCLYLGWTERLQNIVPSILPSWNENMPLYGYLQGMYAFGLCENNNFQEAEQWAKLGLKTNHHDIISSHALAHVYDMQCRVNEGIEFLSSTEKDWSVCNMLAGHNYWHWAIFLSEKGDFNEALDLFDTKISKRCFKDHSMVDLSDASSFLYRLQFEDVDVGKRWNGVCEAFNMHADKLVTLFYDVHLLMASLGAHDTQTTQQFMTNLRKYSNGQTINRKLCQDYGVALCDAMIAYNDDDFATAVELLHPVRHELPRIGGSKAQQDVFDLFLISAAIKSDRNTHWKYARSLLNEKLMLKPNSQRTQRFGAQLDRKLKVSVI